VKQCELTAAVVACKVCCCRCGVQRRCQTNAQGRTRSCGSQRCCHLSSYAPPTHQLPANYINTSIRHPWIGTE